MRKTRVAIAGFGGVGRALARLIAAKREEIARRYGVLLEVVGVADSKGRAVNPNGFTPYELLKMSESPRSSLKDFKPYGREGSGIEALLDEAQPDVHVEATPSNYETGEPGMTNIRSALSRRVHVVTANKAPLVLGFRELTSLARARGVVLRFGATVMGGSPFVATLSYMKSREIVRLEGVLNATTNYILTLMEEELLDFNRALREAQVAGVAEPDPTLDVKGLDSAAKLVIISNIVGYPVEFREIEVEPLDSISVKDIVSAVKQGQTVKYIAELDVRKRKGRVSVKRVSRDSILASVKGLDNCVIIETDVGSVMLIGRGGGVVETAHTLLDDVLSISIREEEAP